MRRLLAAPVAVAVATVAAALTGCGGPAPGTAPAGGDLAGTVTVFAAASLTEAFGTLGTEFEARHAGVTVRFNFAASSALAASIGQGAPADVFASASEATMRTVVDGGRAAGPRVFATNVLAIAVPPGNPAGVTRPADLARPGLKVALCQRQVPCGGTAQAVLARAGVSVTPVTYGADVKAVLTAVRLGEVDAGLVYATDVRAAGAAVTGIPIPADRNAATAYPVAVLDDAPNEAAARAFVDLVLSAEGRRVLTGAGFTAP